MNVALCLSGHARTYNRTYRFWHENLISHHPTDVFIHMWDTIGPRWFGEDKVESANPLPRKDHHSGIVESSLVNVDHVREVWNPISLEVSPYLHCHRHFERQVAPIWDERNRRGIAEGFDHHHPLSVRSMLYKRMLCNRMKKDREYLVNQGYDLVIQCRMDVALTKPLDEEVLTNQQPIYFHNSRSISKFPEICDFGAIGTSKQIDFWTDLYFNIDEEFDNAGEDFFQFLNPHRMYAQYLLSTEVPYVERDLGMCIVRDTGIILGWPEAASIVREKLNES